MRAMQLAKIGQPLVLSTLPDPQPGASEVRVQVTACGVCRTDLHVVDGDLPNPKLPIIPGHEIVGRIDRIGKDVRSLRLGMRVGVPWLGFTCGVCPYCQKGAENLCDYPLFTGYTRDGGYADYVVADARYTFELPEEGNDVAPAALRRINWLAISSDGWRGKENRPLRIWSCRAHHRPGCSMARPKSLCVHATRRSCGSAIC